MRCLLVCVHVAEVMFVVSDEGKSVAGLSLCHALEVSFDQNSIGHAVLVLMVARSLALERPIGGAKLDLIADFDRRSRIQQVFNPDELADGRATDKRDAMIYVR